MTERGLDELAQRDRLDRMALVVVDAQQGFDDAAFWGPRNNPACDDNIARLAARWADAGRPLVYVRHDSDEPGSPLRVGSPGNALKPYLEARPDLLVTKSVNSSFHGSPDLHAWLVAQGLDGIVVCGITTNHCCETTARVGGNLGHRVLFVLDATHTFDRTGPDGTVVTRTSSPASPPPTCRASSPRWSAPPTSSHDVAGTASRAPGGLGRMTLPRCTVCTGS